MHRRHLIHSTLSGAAGLSISGRLLAAPAGSPRFLMVFLRGGYDALSLLVPAASQGSFYREVRPNIAVVAAAAATDKPGAVASPEALPLNNDWSLHPAMQASLMPLVARRQICFVPYAGTDDLTRSHFETQDSIELGQALTGRRDYGSGFLNRLAGLMHGAPGASGASPLLAGSDAIAFTDQLPLVMRGELGIANLSLKLDPKAGDDKLRAALAGMYRDHPLQDRVAGAFEVRQDAARQIAATASAAPAAAPAGMAGEQVSANRGAITAKGFELEARRIARLMRERYALGFVDVGGWDTHVGQGAATGYLASRFEELGRGLAAYVEELGAAAWRNTVVVVISEFGRTARENGNRGTDHGHGSVHWVLGGSLAAGAVAGEQQAFEAKSLHQNRDLPVLNEYRGVLGGLLARQFALSPAQLDLVFPGARAKDIGLI
jgi:uncharacterized protein (DUF1501 family)